jgi:hypothetical protein
MGATGFNGCRSREVRDPKVTPLHTLELTLWHPATRYDRALMDATFAPDFHEFGRSGRRYTRAELLDATPHDFHATLHDFTEHHLSDTITLTTYISELHTPEGPERANRSSIWDRSSGHWQLRFHQATPT